MIKTRLNSRERERLYKFLVARDGEKCKDCGRTTRLHGIKLVIDRIDNNDPEYAREKIQLLCKSCNRKKDPHKRAERSIDTVRVCVSTKKMKEAEYTTEIEINRAKEPKFRKYAKNRVKREPNGVSMQDIIDGGAEVLEISPRTTERYLRKLCSSEGPYEKFRTEKEFVIKRKKHKKK